ncbi:MAG: 23S rRNA (adenine(2503)-C(2))-methyltransferase RlmN, partial [Clostridia bacterium]|nr:23S rRNA (adenine(2503)-C(2))-methyltransferase RlmN [Clostridia bacterium]
SKIDGTQKYLFKLYDGELIESVFMRYQHGNTLCISSQVGCRMGCKFCASTLLGRTRDLLPSEMLGQIIAAEKDTGERISNVVMMGIGEPLDNYDNTIKFLKLVSSDDGLNIGLRHISVSTCGLVDKIERLSEENLPVTLSISLHAYDNSVRDEIMPVNKKYPIEVLLGACQKYFEKTSRRISFEYTLIAGKNDTAEGACRLAAIIKKYIKSPCHVNLIPLNEVKETKLETSKNVTNFKNKLLSLGINATVRRRLGADINASCGQLRKGAKEVNR